MSRNYFQHSTNYKTLNGLRGGISEQRFDQSLLPSVTDTYDLGSGTLRWQEVFANKVEAIGGESRFTEVDVTNTLRTQDLIVTGNTTYALLSANQASISALDVTNLGAQGTEILVGDDVRMGVSEVLYTNNVRSNPTGGEISVGDDVRMGANEVLYTNNVRSSTTGGEISVGDDVRMDVNEILYTNKIRSNPAGGTVTVYDDLTVLGTLNYTLPPASTGVFGTLSDTEIGDLVTDPLDASPPEAANSNLQPAAERVLSAPTINATQWISTPFLTLMGLAQTDKLKVTSNLIPASKTDYNNSAFWNEGGAILQGRTYIDAECIPQTLSVVGNATVGGTLGVTGAATLSSTLGVTGAATLSSTLGVTGATTLSSTLGVTGATTLTSLNVSGAAKIGANPPDGTAYASVDNSKAVIQSAQAHTTSDHSGTLMVLDNSSTSGSSGGKGGSVVFAGPYHDFGSDFYGAAGRIRGITSSGAYGGALTLETAGGGGAMARRMTIDAGGNVGINTTTPAYRFDVSGEVRTDNNLYCAGYIGIGTTSPAHALDVRGTIVTNANMFVNGGYLGVGTVSPDRPLDVVGAARVSNGITSTLSGDATASTSGPNTFTGGLAVAGKSVMRNLALTNGVDTSMDIVVGSKDGTPTAGWVTFDPNPGVGGTFFYDNMEVSGTVQVNNGVVSTLTGNASSTTSGPNRFAGGLAVNGASVMNSLNVTSSLTFPTTGLVTIPNLRTTAFSVARLEECPLSGANQEIPADYFAPNSVITRSGTGPFSDTTVTATEIIDQLVAYNLTDTRVAYFVYLRNDTANAWTVTWGAGINASGRPFITLASGTSAAIQVIRTNSSSALSFRLGSLSDISSYATYQNSLQQCVTFSNTSSGTIEYPADYLVVNSVIYRSGGGAVTDTFPSAASVVTALRAKLGGNVTLTAGTTWTGVVVNNRTGNLSWNTYTDTTLFPTGGAPLGTTVARAFRVIITNPSTPEMTVIIGG